MPPTNRRPRAIDTSRHFCPHPGCDYRGWPGLGNLRANGHPNGGPWRQFQCTACDGYFPEHHGTIFHGKRVPAELIVRVLACLAEGLGIRATARVFEMDPNTVLGWLVEAADQLPAFTRYFLCDVHVASCNSTSSMPCSAASKLASSVQTKPSSAWSAPAPGCGRPSIRRANCCWRLRWGHGPWRWPSGWCTRSLAC